jgi:hypothetical protein
MPIRQKKKSLSEFRQRLKRRGVVRLEVHVGKGDAALVRGMVTALSDPCRESETRSLLREHFGASKATGLKALLVSAPLEDINLSRNHDLGRERKL